MVAIATAANMARFPRHAFVAAGAHAFAGAPQHPHARAGTADDEPPGRGTALTLAGSATPRAATARTKHDAG